MASNVREDLSSESKFADRLAIQTGLLRCSGGGEFDVFNTEFIESFGNFYFLGGIEECICELLAFSLRN